MFAAAVLEILLQKLFSLAQQYFLYLVRCSHLHFSEVSFHLRSYLFKIIVSFSFLCKRCPPLMKFEFPQYLFEHASLDDFRKLNKNSQRWYFAWENLQEVFVMLVVVVFTFRGYFSMSLFAKSELVRSLMLHPFGHRAIQSKRLFIKPGIQKRGTECRECGERGEFVLGFRGISKRIPGNVIISTFQGMFQKILENV